MRGVIAFLLVSVSAVAILAAPSTAAPPPCGARAAAPAGARHVIVIVLENHSFDEVAGSSPFLESLARRCGLARDYRAVAHPSLPNYIALTSGGTWGISDDCTDCSLGEPSIFQQLGGGWRAYEEGLPRPGFTGASSGRYAKKHDPAAYYRNIQTAFARQAVPLADLARDLRSGRLPKLAFVTPDLCNDEHDCPLATGDAWLARWVPAILASSDYRDGSAALFITYDEGSGDQRVYTVVASAATRPGTVSIEPFTHYSLLRTAEELLGVPCLAQACAAPSMRHAFHL